MTKCAAVCRVETMLLWLFVCVAASRAQNIQSWNEVDLTARWREVNLTFPFLARIDLASLDLQLTAAGITADMSLTRHITATAGYFFGELPQPSLSVHIPLAACTFSWNWRTFEFADRNRVEQLIGYKDSPYRYRNRLLLDRPFGYGDHWHAFAENEVFLTSGSGWNQDRLQLGMGKMLAPSARLDVYYLLKNSRGASAIQVVGTTLKFALSHPT